MIYLEDIALGDRFESSRRTVFDADIVNFAGLSGDFNRLHVDEEFGRASIHGRRIAHGLLVTSIASGLRSRVDDFALVALMEMTRRFRAPCFPGDTVHIAFEVTGVRASSSRPELGIVTLAEQILNQDGEVLQDGHEVLMIERRPT